MVENYPVILRMKISDPHLIYGAKKVTAPVRVCPALLSINFSPSLRKSWFSGPPQPPGVWLIEYSLSRGSNPSKYHFTTLWSMSKRSRACPKDPENPKNPKEIQRNPKFPMEFLKKSKGIRKFPWEAYKYLSQISNNFKVQSTFQKSQKKSQKQEISTAPLILPQNQEKSPKVLKISNYMLHSEKWFVTEISKNPQ